MKKYGKRLCLGIGLLLLVMGMTAFAAEGTILNGVKIGGIDVSGMTRTEAVKALEDYEKRLGEQTVSLEIGEEIVEADLSDFGVSFANTDMIDEALSIGRTGNIVKRYKDQKDLQHNGKEFALSWEADEALVRSYVQENCTKFDREAKNASLSRSDGEFHFVAGTQGLVLDVDGSVRSIMDYLENHWSEETSNKIALPTKITEPEGSAEELAHVKDLLGTFSTKFTSSNANRIKNVNSAAGYIDGTVMYPGDEFSTHDVIAPFTEERGYAEAGNYVNGEVVDGMGGGVCQVSTTLYNAVLRAELEVTQRAPHSMTVSYVKLSEDAAIAGTYKDFRFKNSLDYPIYIEGYTTSDKKVVFSIYGKETRPANRSISFESVQLSESGSNTVLVADAGQPIGYKAATGGSKGYTAELYKIVTVDGVQTERTRVNKSTYQGGKRTVVYGVAGDPALSENLCAAIALQDEALADANIAAAAAAAAPPPEEAPVE